MQRNSSSSETASTSAVRFIVGIYPQRHFDRHRESGALVRSGANLSSTSTNQSIRCPIAAAYRCNVASVGLGAFAFSSRESVACQLREIPIRTACGSEAS